MEEADWQRAGAVALAATERAAALADLEACKALGEMAAALVVPEETVAARVVAARQEGPHHPGKPVREEAAKEEMAAAVQPAMVELEAVVEFVGVAAAAAAAALVL